MDIRGMEQYYIATAEGKTEGPYSFEELEAFYTHGKIGIDTLVCVAGGQEWKEFQTILSQKGKGLPDRHAKKRFVEFILDEIDKKPALLKIQELNEQMDAQSDAERFLKLFQTVEDIFRIVGIIALISGFMLFWDNVEEKQTEIGFIYLVSGAFSCLGCFWCAKVITLLSRAVNVLSALDKKLDSFFNKE